MHCPKCGQLQASDEIRFCSKCGLPLSGILELVSNQGVLRGTFEKGLEAPSSPRRRGLKQGLFILLLSFLLIPLAIAFSLGVSAKPTVAVMIAILTITGGLLRMVYALMFESNISAENAFRPNTLHSSQEFPNHQESPKKLNASGYVFASAYVSPASEAWRETNDLQPVSSVTDNTTKLLQNEPDN